MPVRREGIFFAGKRGRRFNCFASQNVVFAVEAFFFAVEAGRRFLFCFAKWCFAV